MLRGLSLSLGLLAVLSVARAAEPIRMEISSTGGPPLNFLIGGNNLENVITQVVKRQGELAALAGQPFVANLNYLGVPNAVILNVAADGRSANLSIPSAGVTRDFNAANPSALNDQIEDFISKQGSAQLAEMRREINRVSPVGITDGNPNSTTALFAENFFDALGLSPGRQFGDATEADRPTRISVIGAAGGFSAAEFQGWRYSGRIQVDHRISSKLALVAFAPVNYITIEGAKVYGFGVGVGLPWAVVGDFDQRAFRWTVAPFAGAMFRWSVDLAGGGAALTAGVNTMITQPLGDNWEASLIGQISGYQGVPFDIDGYELDKVVDQQVLKVGAQMVYRFNERWQTETYAIGNRFMQPAAVQNWFTFGVGLQARLGGGWSARVAYVLDTGNNYTGNSGRLQIAWAF